MPRRTTLLTPLVTVPVISALLVMVAVQKLPGTINAGFSPRGTTPRDMTGTSNAAAGRDRIGEIQSVGLEDIQARIRASDEEWKVIGPKLRRVLAAAVRARAQIGGAEARPAVDFIIRALPDASETDGYNMMIYLALLGPVAHDAADTIRNTRIKNPALPSVTLWGVSRDV